MGLCKSNLKTKDKLKIFQRDNWKCYLCGVRLVSGENATVDHVIPFVFTGTNHRKDLRACCVECNNKRAVETQSHCWELRDLLELGMQPEKALEIILENYYR